MAGDRILTVCNIINPFSVKFLCIQLHHGSIAGKLSVTGVASSLHMRTIRRNAAVHIVKLGTDISLLQPVQNFITGGKIRIHLHIAVDHHTILYFCISSYLKITKTKPGETAMHFTLCSICVEYHFLLVGIFFYQTAFFI